MPAAFPYEPRLGELERREPTSRVPLIPLYDRARLRGPTFFETTSSEKRMSTKYELKNLATGKSTQLDSRSGTIGPDVINISNLTKDIGVFTFDPGIHGHRQYGEQDHLYRRR
jgi:hypothetical protein